MKERIQAISAATDFIEDHLVEPITVADIAAAAGYSLYHFIRTFNKVVKHTPYDYLMRRRLSEAALALLRDEQRVIDIALDYQFNNHETFTRAFRRVFGMPPTSWRELGFPENRILMPALDDEYLEYLNGPDITPPRLVKLDEIILAGLMTALDDDLRASQSLWRNLKESIKVLPDHAEPKDFWGIRIPPGTANGTPFYLAAYKIRPSDSVPSMFVTKIIPTGDYFCITQPELSINAYLPFKALYYTFLPKSDFVLGEPLEIEHFGKLHEILIPIQLPSTRDESVKENFI